MTGMRAFELELEQFGRTVAQWRERAASMSAAASGAATAHGVDVSDFLAAVESLNTAEEELRLQNEALCEAREAGDAERHRYQRLFELAPDAYVVTDLDGVILAANRAATGMLGVAHRFLIDKPLATFVENASRRTFRKHLGLARENVSTDPWACEVRSRHGSTISSEMTVSSVGDRHSRPTELRWIIRDVSKRRKADEDVRQQLEQATRLRDELLGMASLELRTSVQSLIAYAALMPMKLGDQVTPDTRKYLERIEAITRDITGIVNRFLHRSGGEISGSAPTPSVPTA